MAVVASQLILFPSIMNSIATLSSNVFNLMSSFRISKDPHTVELQTLLEKSDIVCTIGLVKHILTDLEEDQTFKLKSTVVFAVEKIQTIIGIIDTELKDIQAKIDYNSSLYLLQNMRSIDCSINLTKMETNILILEKRVNHLFQVLDC